jgi:hypothetical protein
MERQKKERQNGEWRAITVTVSCVSSSCHRPIGFPTIGMRPQNTPQRNNKYSQQEEQVGNKKKFLVRE